MDSARVLSHGFSIRLGRQVRVEKLRSLLQSVEEETAELCRSISNTRQNRMGVAGRRRAVGKAPSTTSTPEQLRLPAGTCLNRDGRGNVQSGTYPKVPIDTYLDILHRKDSCDPNPILAPSHASTPHHFHYPLRSHGLTFSLSALFITI